MFYLLSILVAAQLVLGQTFWKIGASQASFTPSLSYIFSERGLKFFLSPYILGGAFIYIVATVIYMGMLAKYEYSAVQGAVLPLSLVAAFIVARFFFGEKLTLETLFGLVLLLVGVVLVTKR